MALQMKTRCKHCEAELLPAGRAYICSYECSYCESCAEHLLYICPECEGEIVRRPKRSAGQEMAGNR